MSKKYIYMWYLIVGNLLSLFTYSLYFSYVYNLKQIDSIETFFGWFFLEHVFEEYGTTSGKLFLIYEDFRNLIKNLLLLVRNFFLMAQFFTPAEFLFINIVLIFLIFKYKKKLRSNAVKVFIVFVYVSILNSFLFINVFNVLHIFKYICVYYLLFSVVIIYIQIFYQAFFVRLSYKKKSNAYLKLFVVKCFGYLLILFFSTCLIIFFLNKYVNFNENFIQEFLINNLILYLYVYYFF